MIRNILFDLDGTLTDPKTGIVGCIRYALAELGVEAPVDDELLWCIGPPLKQSFEKLLAGRRDEAERALALYRVRFGDVGMYENDVYDGVPALLETLSDRNLFVATSKPQVYAKPILEHFGLAHYFQGIYGSELDGARSDKRHLLGHLLAEQKLTAAETVMIGDRRHDAEGARANGLTTIWVEWGYGDKAECDEVKPDHICPTIDHLANVLNRL